jgi:hypothetical protein
MSFLGPTVDNYFTSNVKEVLVLRRHHSYNRLLFKRKVNCLSLIGNLTAQIRSTTRYVGYNICRQFLFLSVIDYTSMKLE